MVVGGSDTYGPEILRSESIDRGKSNRLIEGSLIDWWREVDSIERG